MRRLLMIVVIGVFVIGACACGGDDDSSSGTTRPTTNGSTVVEPAPGELGPGVSEDTIKIAISLVDFDCIKDFVDEIRVDQEDTYRAFVDDINDNGGINGRMIEPVFKTHCPIPGASRARSACAPRPPRTTRCSPFSVPSSTSRVMLSSV